MERSKHAASRRAVLASMAGFGLAAGMWPTRAPAAPGPALTRPVPSSGERLPVVGMGSSITFNVGKDAAKRAARVEVLRTFFETGGALIDSSPMYGSSEAVIGHCLERIAERPALFSATKVWTLSKWLGIGQMRASRELWGVERFDLMQIHNLLDWEAHLETLLEWKAEGRVRHRRPAAVG